MFNLIQNFDSSMMYKVQELHTPLLNNIMIFFTKIGDAGLFWLVVGLIFLFIKKYRRVGIVLYLSQLLTVIVTTILKETIERPRPFTTLADLHPLVAHPTSFSFPSGHSSAAFAGAVIVGYYIKKWIIPAYGVAVLIAFSRLYVGVHYPSDIIVGSIIGILGSVVTIQLVKKFWIPIKPKKS